MFGIAFRGIREGASVFLVLAKIIFPVTVIITILQYTPVLPFLIELITPFMHVLGLSGEAAMPLVLGNALGLYAGIGAIISFEFTVKEVFIMAMMLSFSHNIFVESAVASRVGVSWWLVSLIRIVLAIFSALIINLVWDGGAEIAQYGFLASSEVVLHSWGAIVLHGFKTALMAIIQISLIIFPLMIIMQFLRELGLLHKISKLCAPFTKMLGMKENTSFTLVAGMIVGLSMGAGVMIQAVKEDGVSKKDTMLALIFLVSCHAVIEDTVVFIPLGIPVWPLLVIRFLTAVILTVIVAIVWNRIEKTQKERKLKYEH
ncbi:nucleoside recognition domain-containing protein [Pseudogracilibacillus sp. ICA-222130]|uniref:nucleoside recognition domain-containing protein n=1 Tax=Pseudogracilibacillus sp. ICA-222130 TaxID=3134655 RepID=UPI0030BF9E88